MAISMDKMLSIYPDALRLRAKRTELLAANIANADTPGYKARDIDFNAAMQQASKQGGGGLKTTHPGHIQGGGHAGANAFDDFVRFRVPQQPSLDGNTVESHVEQAKFAEHAIEYQLTLKNLQGRFKSVTDAIKGGGN